MFLDTCPAKSGDELRMPIGQGSGTDHNLPNFRVQILDQNLREYYF